MAVKPMPPAIELVVELDDCLLHAVRIDLPEGVLCGPAGPGRSALVTLSLSSDPAIPPQVAVEPLGRTDAGTVPSPYTMARARDALVHPVASRTVTKYDANGRQVGISVVYPPCELPPSGPAADGPSEANETPDDDATEPHIVG